MSLQMEANLEPYLTISELAKRATIPLKRDKLRELVERGVIRSYRVDKKILVLESEVHEDIKRHFKRRPLKGGHRWRP